MIINEKVCIVGLGYVGLTLGVALAKAGVEVYGAEINDDILKALKEKRAHFSEKGLDDALVEVLKSGKFTFGKKIPIDNDFSTFIITVGTPLNNSGVPRTDMIERSAVEISNAMNDDSLVILRSTVVIGACREIVDPILQECGKQYHLAMCPERTLEGKALEELLELPQIIGTEDSITYDLCFNIFKKLTNKVIGVSSWETAEIIKLVDNTSRDLSFAFSNEIAKVCNLFHVDAYEVINQGKYGYKRTNLPEPGPVGGPCLEKDPHILKFSANKKGFEPVITKSGRETNEGQITEIADKLKNKINHGSKILLSGLAFKGVPETDDLRGSMGLKFLDELDGYDVYLHDAIVCKEDLIKYGRVFNFDQKIEFDLIVILNNHPFYSNNGFKVFKNNLLEGSIIFDFWRTLGLYDDVSNYYHLGNLYKL